MTDSIADMLSRIRNAQAVKKKTAIIPYSNLKWEILSAFEKYGFVGELNKFGRGAKKTIEVALKYTKDNSPKIINLKRVSKPSRRVYVGAKQIWPLKRGSGTMIISTPKGIMTDKEAKKENTGGEVLLEIY